MRVFAFLQNQTVLYILVFIIFFRICFVQYAGEVPVAFKNQIIIFDYHTRDQSQKILNKCFYHEVTLH